MRRILSRSSSDLIEYFTSQVQKVEWNFRRIYLYHRFGCNNSPNPKAYNRLFDSHQLNTSIYLSLDSVTTQPLCYFQTHIHSSYIKFSSYYYYYYYFLFFIILYHHWYIYRRVCVLIFVHTFISILKGGCAFLVPGSPHNLLLRELWVDTKHIFFWTFKYSSWKFTWSVIEIPHNR
jgi:hypothetical protein